MVSNPERDLENGKSMVGVFAELGHRTMQHIGAQRWYFLVLHAKRAG